MRALRLLVATVVRFVIGFWLLVRAASLSNFALNGISASAQRSPLQ